MFRIKVSPFVNLPTAGRCVSRCNPGNKNYSLYKICYQVSVVIMYAEVAVQAVCDKIAVAVIDELIVRAFHFTQLICSGKIRIIKIIQAVSN